jgi:hypothetical protein
MRLAILITIVVAASPAAAGDGFSLGLAEMDFSAAEGKPEADRLPASAGAHAAGESNAELAFHAALNPTSAAERTQALWNSDLGRVHLALAAEHAMLGREGLVNGGRMAGVGLGTAAIGDGDPNGTLGMALGRGKWAEMNANQKLQATVEASFLAALLAFMVSAAD